MAIPLPYILGGAGVLGLLLLAGTSSAAPNPPRPSPQPNPPRPPNGGRVPFPPGSALARVTLANEPQFNGVNVRTAPNTSAPIVPGNTAFRGREVAVLETGIADQSNPPTSRIWWRVITDSGSTGFASAIDPAGNENFTPIGDVPLPDAVAGLLGPHGAPGAPGIPGHVFDYDTVGAPMTAFPSLQTALGRDRRRRAELARFYGRGRWGRWSSRYGYPGENIIVSPVIETAPIVVQPSFPALPGGPVRCALPQGCPTYSAPVGAPSIFAGRPNGGRIAPNQVVNTLPDGGRGRPGWAYAQGAGWIPLSAFTQA